MLAGFTPWAAGSAAGSLCRSYRPGWRSFGTSGLVTGITVTRWSKPMKSSGFVVYNGNSAVIAIAAIIRSTTRRRGFRPAASRLHSRGRRCERHPCRRGSGRTRSRHAGGRLVGEPARPPRRTRPAPRRGAPLRTGGKLRQRDGANGHLLGQLSGSDPLAKDHDVRV